MRMAVDGLGGIRGTGPAKMGSTWSAMLPGPEGADTGVISEAGITWGKAPMGAGGGVGQGGTWARAAEGPKRPINSATSPKLAGHAIRAAVRQSFIR